MEKRYEDELFSYMVSIRRNLHEYPEVGFDLDRTVALVSGELESMGIEYTLKYGKGSVVAEIGKGDKTVALRADMDALPVEEKTGLTFASKIKGKMHACGHDSHTAVMLAVAKYLKAHEEDLNCRVRFVFQPSEEGQISGAKMMVENGVMDGVDHIFGAHCEETIDTGRMGLCSGDHMAACVPMTIAFLGKTSHATIPECGIDAIAMASEAYVKLKDMVKEAAQGQRYIWSVGRFQGGHVHNVIADRCEMDISFRFYDMDFANRVEQGTRRVCEDIAKAYGGKVDINFKMSTGPVHNDEKLCENFEKVLEKEGLPLDKVGVKLSSEDFGWYLTKVPGVFFRFGTRNEELGHTGAAHQNDYTIDEEGMRYGLRAFVAYVQSIK